MLWTIPFCSQPLLRQAESPVPKCVPYVESNLLCWATWIKHVMFENTGATKFTFLKEIGSQMVYLKLSLHIKLAHEKVFDHWTHYIHHLHIHWPYAGCPTQGLFITQTLEIISFLNSLTLISLKNLTVTALLVRQLWRNPPASISSSERGRDTFCPDLCKYVSSAGANLYLYFSLSANFLSRPFTRALSTHITSSASSSLSHYALHARCRPMYHWK